MPLVEEEATSVLTAVRYARPRAVNLLGQLDENQGRTTFTGRMTLDQFCDLCIVYNRKWADGAGESMEMVTQREIIDAHANLLALFIIQGLVAASLSRGVQEGFSPEVIEALERIQNRVGHQSHYGMPQVTLVLQELPQVRVIKDEDGTPIAARLLLQAGKLFSVADGQHRREAAQRVREFLHHVIGHRRTPKSTKFYPATDAPITATEVDAWTVVQETFRSTTVIAYEAHLGLTVAEARQLFTNFNCHVRPVKPDVNLEFDSSNPINRFQKTWLRNVLEAAEGDQEYDLKALSGINGFLFMGKTSIKSAPHDVSVLEPSAKKFWEFVTSRPEFARDGSRLREIPVLKALAKTWFMVYLAKRNSQRARAARLNEYVSQARFDDQWMEGVSGLKRHTVPTEDGGWRFSPAHNDIVGAIVRDILS